MDKAFTNTYSGGDIEIDCDDIDESEDNILKVFNNKHAMPADKRR